MKKDGPARPWRPLFLLGGALAILFVLSGVATDGLSRSGIRFVQAPFRAVGWLVASDEIKKVAPGEDVGDYIARAIWLVVFPFLAVWCLVAAWLNKRKEERERERWGGRRQ
jgi:hypothetical protein